MVELGVPAKRPNHGEGELLPTMTKTKGNNIGQLKAYISQIKSMKGLKIIQANRKNFGANTALNTLKKNLQDQYKIESNGFFDAFYNNVDLRTSIWNDGNIEYEVAKKKFINSINIQISSNNSNDYFDFVSLIDLK